MTRATEATRAGRGTAGALAGALLVVLAAGCGETADEGSGPAPGTPRTSSSAPAPSPGQTLLEMTVTGGIAGVDKRLTVREDGSWTSTAKSGAEHTGRMTPAELTGLNRALEKSDFAHLPATPTGTPVADGFLYRITYAGRTVVTADGSQPAGLRDVLSALPDI